MESMGCPRELVQDVAVRHGADLAEAFEEQIASSLIQMLLGRAGLADSRSVHFRSDVGDDYSPFEYSLAFSSRGATMRLLTEPQGENASLVSNRDEALRILRELESEGRVTLDRLRQVEDLFLPAEPQGRFSVWLATETGPTADLKIYLNPEARGPELARELVHLAVQRLGFEAAWGEYEREVLDAGGGDLKYVSLDLGRAGKQRLKLYTRHPNATADRLERIGALGFMHQRGDILSFLAQLTPGRHEFDGGAVALCAAFHVGDPMRPASITTYLPISRYVESDDEATSRVSSLLESLGLDTERYLRSVALYRSLRCGLAHGTHSYVSFKRGRGLPVVTVYFASGLYERGMDRAPAAELEQARARLRSTSIGTHRFWTRLANEPASASRMWLLLESAMVAMVQPFPARFATLIARITDARIRCLLAEMLSCELGSGEPDAVHSLLFGRMRLALIDSPMEGEINALMGPAHRLAQTLDALHFESDPYEGLGALLACEVLGENVNAAMVRELERLPNARNATDFMRLHHGAEAIHAVEVDRVLGYVTLDHAPELNSGVEKAMCAAVSFFDELCEVCFENSREG